MEPRSEIVPHKDVVYYWAGGTSPGWRVAHSGSDAGSATIAYLTQQGYVAVRGSTAIGPPEGPPSIARLRAVLWANRDRAFMARNIAATEADALARSRSEDE